MRLHNGAIVVIATLFLIFRYTNLNRVNLKNYFHCEKLKMCPYLYGKMGKRIFVAILKEKFAVYVFSPF